MLQLNRQEIKDIKSWETVGIKMPHFDFERTRQHTMENPQWVHFGAGNIFRGFPAALQQQLLDTGRADTGIIAVEAFDTEIIDRIYKPYDNLSLLVIMNSDGTLESKVIASISESLIAEPSQTADWQRLEKIFSQPSLQMVSFTITEKGYNLKQINGEYFPDVCHDMQNGPAHPRHIMAKITALTLIRYQNGQLPLALVSLDNCSHNGEKLFSAVTVIAEQWCKNGFVNQDFLAYLRDNHKVSFPCSMIDKITPRPSERVGNSLKELGFTSTEIICTSKKTYIAPFVNAEGPQYLVIEDKFPNGRMPLEAAGVFFTDKVTVEKMERMKVCTCLNPLHTALAVFGCLLGYSSIGDEMKDTELKKLVEKIGYSEGLPVVTDPGIIKPNDFLREVIEKRLPNPNIPDTPQRIATDTSQKMGIRFGGTIKAYQERKDLNPATLLFIPLAIAGWCRYLLGLDDQGQVMALSPDPMLEQLQTALAQVQLGNPQSIQNHLHPILSNESLFGLDLYQIGLGVKIEGLFQELIAGKGAIRKTLQKYLN